MVIRRSDDGGLTWTTPEDSQSGLLLVGNRFHCAPVPVVIHNAESGGHMKIMWGSGAQAFGHS